MTSSLPRLLPAIGVAALTGTGLVALALAQGGYDIVDRQTAAVLLWWSVGLAAVVTARRPEVPPLSGLLATAFAAGMVLWIAANIGHSISQERSVIELGRAVTHLAPVVLFGWALPARLWRSVLLGLLVGAVAVCAAALGNRLSPGFLGQTTAIVFTNTASRLASPLGYWNAVGSWSVITTLMLIGVSAHAPRWWQRSAALSAAPLALTVGYLTYSRSSIAALVIGFVVLLAFSQRRWTLGVHAAAAAAAGLVCFLTIASSSQIADATGTDGAGTVLLAIMGTGAALAAVAAAAKRLGLDGVALSRRTARRVVVLTSALAVAAAVLVGATYGPGAWDKFSMPEQAAADASPSARLGSLNNGVRVEQWNLAIDSWQEARLRGSGAGTFELTYNLAGENGFFARDAHSAFLEALSEQGVIGFGLLVGFVLALVGVAASAVRRARSAFDRGLVASASAGLAAFLLGTSIDWFWEVTALALYAMALAGVLVAATKDSGEIDYSGAVDEVSLAEPNAAPVHSRAGGRWLRIVLVVVALIATLTQLPGLIGTSEVRRSQQDVAAGDLVEARGHADQAIDILPWASSPFLQRALVDEQAGAWASARRSMQLAIRRDSQDWRLPLVLARIEAKAGRPESALDAYRRAKALRPRGQFFQ